MVRGEGVDNYEFGPPRVWGGMGNTVIFLVVVVDHGYGLIRYGNHVGDGDCVSGSV